MYSSSLVGITVLKSSVFLEHDEADIRRRNESGDALAGLLTEEFDIGEAAALQPAP